MSVVRIFDPEEAAFSVGLDSAPKGRGFQGLGYIVRRPFVGVSTERESIKLPRCESVGKRNVPKKLEASAAARSTGAEHSALLFFT